MRTHTIALLLMFIAALHAGTPDAPSAPPTPDPVTEPPPAKVHELHFESGTVTIGNHIATIALPDGWRYLQSPDARYWVEQLWGNPPDPSVLGLVVPPAAPEQASAPAEEHPEEGWAIIVTYDQEDGHVKDDDAKSIDYTALLKQMQEGSEAANAQRTKAGYPAVRLLGWAEQPHYDATTRKLYWAKSLQFGKNPTPQLNYNIRVLGRNGVLELNAVAEVSDLKLVAEGAKSVLTATEFVAGNRYEDFKPGIDKVAAYGIGGLVAGTVLTKVGFFALVLKFIKVIAIFLFAVVGGIWKLITGRREKQDEQAERARRSADRDALAKQRAANPPPTGPQDG